MLSKLRLLIVFPLVFTHLLCYLLLTFPLVLLTRLLAGAATATWIESIAFRLYCLPITSAAGIGHQVVLSGDIEEIIRAGGDAFENVLIMANHLGDADGAFLIAFSLHLAALRWQQQHGDNTVKSTFAGRLKAQALLPFRLLFSARASPVDRFRFVVKQVIRYLFPVGPLLALHKTLFLKRKLVDDQTAITRYAQSLAETRTPVWLTIFPEGTYPTPARTQLIEQSRAFAESRGWPRFKCLLTPRYKGMQVMLQAFGKAGSYLDAVYDVTFALRGPFDTRIGVAKSVNMLSLFGGDAMQRNRELDAALLPDKAASEPLSLHVHVRRHPIKDVDHERMDTWLVERFTEKDQLLEHFRQHRTFAGFDGCRVTDAPHLGAWAWFVFLSASSAPAALTAYALWCLGVFCFGAAAMGKLVISLAVGILLLAASAVIFLSLQGRKKSKVKKRE